MSCRTSLFVLITIVVVSHATLEKLHKFSDGNRLFAASTYQHVATQHPEENFLVCQFSVETILSLVQNGAKGETGREMRNAIYLPSKKEQINRFFKDMIVTMGKNKSYTFNSANKIYVKKDLVIKEKFLKTAAEYYRSSVENLDFSMKNEAVKIINEWVSKETNGKIKDLVNGDNVNEETVAVLVNALYFQGSWRKSFKKTLTQSRDFFKTPEEVVQISTMKKHDFLGYYESEDLDSKFLKIPFQGDAISMVIILPNEKNGLFKLEENLTQAFKVSSFDWDMVELTLPKFKIETSINFKDILIQLGMKKAFTRADFSHLAGEKGEIFISDVIQKTFIGVDEHGVEAAASTSVHFHPKSLMEAVDPKIFKVDHPFMFYIQMGDVILFAGRVLDPVEELAR